MKKIFFLFLISLFISACGDGIKNKDAEDFYSMSLDKKKDYCYNKSSQEYNKIRKKINIRLNGSKDKENVKEILKIIYNYKCIIYKVSNIRLTPLDYSRKKIIKKIKKIFDTSGIKVEDYIRY